jgi:hypothetical protein
MSRIITDYYRFEHLPESKSKYRFDSKCSTGSYPAYEALRNKVGDLFIYYTSAEYVRANGRRKADMAINKNKHISSVFVPDVKALFAYGDNRETSDAILLQFNEDRTAFDLFICRGQKDNQRQLYYMLSDGELQADIEAIIRDARKQG